MISGINSAVSALQSLTRKGESTANNVANVNTPGYKASRVTLQDIGGGLAQAGSGVTVSTVSRSGSQGAFEGSQSPSDFAINGQGYFLLRDPGTAVADKYSRTGNFHHDGQGFLVTSAGAFVQGWQLDPQSGERQGSIGDIRIPQTLVALSSDQEESEAAFLQGVATNGQGVISASYSDGRVVQVAQVALANFNDQDGLRSDGGGVYRQTSVSGPAYTDAPGASGLGSLVPGALESSNVDLAEELVSMMITRTSFKANVKMIQAGDEMLGSLLDIKT